ncbi:hypothetical protein UPYG_G00209440 [Umbra pygmaea]|uniref:HECT domain-containing protein n=1 Tax=Umbra pygmaea TaxID=75934 RepID=A0ABD0WPQ4_UMBPY
MRRMDRILKPVRGKSLPLEIHPHCTSEQLLTAAVKKLKDFNQDMQDGPYILLYPDSTETKNIPGTDKPFTLHEYKEAIGKGYQRKRGKTTVHEKQKPSPGQPNFYSNYTDVYAPIVIESDSEESEESEECKEQIEEASIDGLTAADIMANLSMKITRTSASRFNINRADVWEGAVRGFKRSSYDPSTDMVVKFTDDEGQTEEGVDTGGPRREILTLLMDRLRSRRIFDGQEHSKFLTFDTAAAKDDEYFLAGRMIAVSMVHGGPGPRFLSKTLYQHLTGGAMSDFEATINDITDEEMKASMLEISSAATLDELHSLMDKHASLLQTAGCLQYPKSVECKEEILKDFLQWYIIYRNHFSIQRFKDGLSTLDVIHALEQHPNLFRMFMCSSVEQLTAESLEGIFKVQLSDVGSTRRQEETRILGYWRDYLLDTEEQGTGLSLHNILMFATGLNSLPPSSILPQPTLSFERTSSFPIASTCSNTMSLPWTLECKTHQVLDSTELTLDSQSKLGI